MNYKLASAISKYYPLMAIGLVVLAGIGGFWLYQTSRPTYQTKTRQVPSFGYSGEFEHWAQIKENSLLWPDVGENLRNRPVYFTEIMPDLNATFTFDGWGLNPENANVTLNSYLTITCSGNDFDYWSERIHLKNKSSSFSPGGIKMDFLSTPEISPSWIKDKIDNIQGSIGFTGGSTDVKLKVDSTLIRHTVEGTQEKDDVFEMPISLGGATYSVGSDLSKKKEFTKTESEKVKVGPSNLSMVPPALLLIIPLVALGYVVYEGRRIDESNLIRMEKEYWVDEFEEWISRGKMPDKVPEVSLEMNSLEDLVDAAVDMDSRVIYDGENSTFFFIEDNVLYLYSERGPEIEESG